ncbi:DUF7260 family protein [Halobellus captivus]|uniref:DUF7260 family protein n=1 Tax=Halobellus captivus TaxID=2592614 RepID=UPI0011A6B481|nr:hypothetical protein [Halobellus captivus]
MADIDDAVRDLTAARRAVRDERRETERQQRGFEQFRQTVAALEADRSVGGGSTTRTVSATPGWSTGSTTTLATTTNDQCRRVRSAFEEYVLPHVDDEAGSVKATIASELSAEVALALAAEGGGNQFTEPLRRAILERADQRVAENRVMLRALTRERDSLDEATGLLKRVDRKLPTVDESVLLLSTDEELWDRRRRAASLEADLSRALRERQSTLSAMTASEVKAGIAHDTVVEYLFGDRDVTYPALDALVRGNRACRRRIEVLDSSLDRK